MDYSKRRLTNVSVHGLEILREDSTHASGRVSLQLSNYLDEEGGPYITVNLSVPFDDKKSIQEAELALVDGARSLLARFLEMPHEDWKKSLLRVRTDGLNLQPVV